MKLGSPGQILGSIRVPEFWLVISVGFIGEVWGRKKEKEKENINYKMQSHLFFLWQLRSFGVCVRRCCIYFHHTVVASAFFYAAVCRG